MSTVIGSFEKVSFPELGITSVIAKIDTGAFSGAIHAKNIRSFLKNGVPTLQFSSFSQPSRRFSTTNFYTRRARSASGHATRRYIIRTSIVINGAAYEITIGISDRSTLGSDVLIGRQFLRENAMLVDVERNQEHDRDLKIWNKFSEKINTSLAKNTKQPEREQV